VVCAVDGGNDLDALEAFCAGLRARSIARSSVFIFVFESNYGGSQRAAQMVRHVKARCQKPLVVMSEDHTGGNRPGIWVTHDYKERMVQHLRDLLNEDKYAFHKDIYTTTIKGDPQQVLLDQFRNFKRKFKTAGSGPNAAMAADDSLLPYKYTGKGRGMKDDGMMATLEGVYFFDIFLTSDDYMNMVGKRAESTFHVPKKDVDIVYDAEQGVGLKGFMAVERGAYAAAAAAASGTSASTTLPPRASVSSSSSSSRRSSAVPRFT